MFNLFKVWRVHGTSYVYACARSNAAAALCASHAPQTSPPTSPPDTGQHTHHDIRLDRVCFEGVCALPAHNSSNTSYELQRPADVTRTHHWTVHVHDGRLNN